MPEKPSKVYCPDEILDLFVLLFIVRLAYYRLIEEVISQIVLSKNGIDPDFRRTTLNVDVEPLIGTWRVKNCRR